MKYPIISNRDIDITTEFENCCKDNILICTVGLPRSGKSTWAKTTGLPIVSPDGIRLALTGRRWWGPIEHEVWATIRTMLRSLFWSGNKAIILDAPNFQRRARDAVCPSLDVLWTRHFILFDTPVDVCKERAMKTYPVLCDIIDWFAENWEPIEKEEGQIERITFDPSRPNSFYYQKET
jgi:predicted kinase